MKANGHYEHGDPVSLLMITQSETGVQIPFGTGGKFLDWIEVPNRALVGFDVEGYPDPVEVAVDTQRIEFTGTRPEAEPPEDEAEVIAQGEKEIR